MIDFTTRTQVWLVELAAIIEEIDRNGMPPAPRPSVRRIRKRKPFWEE